MKYTPVPNDQYTDKMAKRDKRVINKAIKEAMSNSTQNDWADKTKERVINILGYDHMLHNENCHLCNVAVDDIVNLLADARREVIEKIDHDIIGFEIDNKIQDEKTLRSKHLIDWYNGALLKVRKYLATLRKEGVNG